jgi:hypothetical protein
LVAFTATAALSEELLPADREIPEVIDHYINAALETSSAKPADLASDLIILRRTTLDLAGRIPTLAEVDDTFFRQPGRLQNDSLRLGAKKSVYF